MRAFFCIPLEPSVASSIGQVARRIRDATNMRASWVRDENYHVTLRFLGEIEPGLTVELERLARRVTERLEPFSLTLDRLGCFPSIDRARVLWLGGDPSPVLHALAASLHHELKSLGFPPERKPTVAHVTLARIKARPDPELPRILGESQPGEALEVRADRVVLMESALKPGGAVYRPLFTTRFTRLRPEDGVHGR
jgi:2'-5' RNA ligase